MNQRCSDCGEPKPALRRILNLPLPTCSVCGGAVCPDCRAAIFLCRGKGRTVSVRHGQTRSPLSIPMTYSLYQGNPENTLPYVIKVQFVQHPPITDIGQVTQELVVEAIRQANNEWRAGGASISGGNREQFGGVSMSLPSSSQICQASTTAIGGSVQSLYHMHTTRGSRGDQLWFGWQADPSDNTNVQIYHGFPRKHV